MEKERSHMTERILNLTLEIIYLLTGEIYGPLKDTVGCVTPRYHPHITGWWNRNKSPIMEPPSFSLTSEGNDKKVLEVTQKIIDLLTGEVPIRCQDVTVYFSMEEWEYLEGHKDLYKDLMMENQQTLNDEKCGKNIFFLNERILNLTLEIIDLLTGEECAVVMKTSLENFTKRKNHYSYTRRKILQPIATSPPTYLTLERNSKKKILEVTQKMIELLTGEGEELKDIKVEGKEEEEETLVSGDQQSMEKDGPLSYSRDSIEEYHSFTHHDQGEESQDIKVEIKDEEEERLVSGDQQSMEEGEMIMESKQEESSLHMDTNGRRVRNSSERRPKPSADWNSKDDGIRPTSSEVNPNAQNIPRPHHSSTSMDVSNLEGSSDQSQTIPSDVQLSSHSAETSTDPSNPGGSSLTQEMVHASETPVSCLGCGASFKTRSELVVHLRSHTSVTFSCSECGKSFTEKRELLTHQKTHKSETHPCSECGKCFFEKKRLLSHQRTHTGDRPYSCSECGKCFSEKKRLLLHQRKHTGDCPYSCSECGKCFTEKSVLLSHLRTHTGERPFSCSECGKCFTQQGSLIRHQRRHKSELPFSCSECGKGFTRRAKLFSHQRSHTGERPFFCSVCGKSFTLKENLQRHQRSHMGKNPFSCSECGKCFTRKDYFIRHKCKHAC